MTGTKVPLKRIYDSFHFFFCWQLLNEYLSNKSNTVELLNKADLYMMPVANPDGYIYTHEEV